MFPHPSSRACRTRRPSRLAPLAALLTLCVTVAAQEVAAPAADPVAWQAWSDGAFATARAEHKMVLLDLGAVWCHWCHVMDETTYLDPAVVALLGGHYVAIRVDQDARPDLANRYEDYGWPATIIFDADGKELVKRRGYIPPARMISLLQAVVDDPTPGPSIEAEPERRFPSEARLPDALAAAMRQAVADGYDHEHAGWGHIHKYVDAQTLEYEMLDADGGDQAAKAMAQDTLAAALALIDPIWGGACQYSTGGVWSEPHFEKIMSVQADTIDAYAMAFARWHEPRWRDAALRVHAYLKQFLMAPDGSFYTSQDADLVPGEPGEAYQALDDRGRRALGLPRVDTHRYARENGWAIQALASLAAATGDQGIRDEAIRAARWVMAERALPGGGFRHDERDAAGPYLGDTLAMGRAFLALHSATGDPAWLGAAESARVFIDATFHEDVGYATCAGQHPVSIIRDENVALARWANLLGHVTGVAADHAAAEHAFRYVAEPGIAALLPAAPTLLAARELGVDPLHITIVGAKDDPAAARLFAVAAACPLAYKRVDWWDPREGPLPNPDTEYPASATATAFVCTAGACSPPLRDGLAARLERVVLTGK